MQAISFSFENTAVRTLGTPDLPLFVAIDVATALGYKNTKDAVLRHVDSDDLLKSEITDSLGRKQIVNCVNESGMYALIFGSKLESAKRFKRWVTSEVLPAIRKTGSYSATLTPAEQLQIRKAISARAKKSAVAYQTIYHALYARFQIAKYDQLKTADLQDALDFIATCEVKLPALVDKNSITLSRDEMERIRTLVYYKKYLFRRELDLVYQLLVAVQSPEAPRFYEMMNEANMNEVEKILDHHDMAVKDLPCYRYLAAQH
ncbi:MAG: ORF6C domain-containing protein [Sutterella sp.]|nr:ORF6C domain-containing protein [Sutterella sp.]